jgi:hypothetical protein
MTETPEEIWRRFKESNAGYFEQASKRREPHRARAFEYEKLAVEYSHRAFQLITYLNGGALVAIPTAMAFFRADVGKLDILITASAFIGGLVLIVLAQVAAFFTMAKRVEAAAFRSHAEDQWVLALQFEPLAPEFKKGMLASENDSATALRKDRTSDIWRTIGLMMFAFSLMSFVAGCGWGAWVVLLAKEVAAKP